MFNDTFYPTPEHLIDKMLDKVDGDPVAILEPSAGKGDIIKRFDSKFYNHRRSKFRAIEKDPDLRATLRGKGIKVIDSDFLTYAGPDKFDLIIANPPFNEGAKHLMKAIEILYRGQIIFLLNAETIRNTGTNIRKALKQKLDDLDADIEFIKNGFVDAERKTKVEVALVSIKVDRKVEEDLFKDVESAAPVDEDDIKEKHEVSTGKKLVELVAEYNQVVSLGTETIVSYYRNYGKVGKYIGLNKEADKYTYGEEDLTKKMQNRLNELLRDVRKDFWRRTFELPEVYKRMTKARRAEFEGALNERSDMDFTENNVRSFVLNLISGYEDALIAAVLKLFDKFTMHGYCGMNAQEKNVHYFNGWKTNDAFKVGKRIIIPIYSYGGPFQSYGGKWDLQYDAAEEIRDFDIVMNYFDGLSDYHRLTDAMNYSFSNGYSRGIESTYFTAAAYKKGTLHLTFMDEDILRRFNVVACRGKGWLPCDYGEKAYGNMAIEERSVVDSFEGEKSYNENLMKPLFAVKSSQLRLTEEGVESEDVEIEDDPYSELPMFTTSE